MKVVPPQPPRRPIAITLQELSQAIQELNEQSDEINPIIECLNVELAALNVGLTINDGPLISQTGWAIERINRNNGSEPIERTRINCYLGYARLRDECQLVVSKREEQQEYEEQQDRWKDLIESNQIDFMLLVDAARKILSWKAATG